MAEKNERARSRGREREGLYRIFIDSFWMWLLFIGNNFNHCINKHVFISLLFRSNLVISMSFSHSSQFYSTHSHARTHAVSMSTKHSFQSTRAIYNYLLVRFGVYEFLFVVLWMSVCILCYLLFFFFLLHPHVSVYFDIFCCSFHQFCCAFLFIVWI